MAECFELFDLKSCIITSFDTLPLDVYFGYLLTGSNFSDRYFIATKNDREKKRKKTNEIVIRIYTLPAPPPDPPRPASPGSISLDTYFEGDISSVALVC